jgi:hypothetical protein
MQIRSQWTSCGLVAPMPTCAARDVLGEHQALTLVEPQRVRGQPRLPCDVADAELMFGDRHGPTLALDLECTLGSTVGS